MLQVNYCFIVNPLAGGGLAGRNWPGLRKLLLAAGIDHCFYLSEYRGHCDELTAAAFASGHRNFVAVGGDGTANEVLNGLLRVCGPDLLEISLGIVPWGTGNDWARYYGFSPAPEACVRRLQSGFSSLQDIGRANFIDAEGVSRSHYFLNCAGTGFDSYLLDQMETNALINRCRYFLYLLKCLLKFRASPLHLGMNGTSFEGPVLLLEICLGRFAGAGMCFAPKAAVDDGLFEILLVRDMSITQLLGSLLYLYNGKISQHWAVSNWQCRFLSVAAQATQSLHCDGELVGNLPVEIEILPRALKVLTGADKPPLAG